MASRWRAVLLVVSTLAGATGTASNQSDTRTLLRRAGDYVVRYHESLSTVVADEVYVQTLTPNPSGKVMQRTLHSEFAIVRGEPDEGWFAIRDVAKVDGHPAKERSGFDSLLKVPRSGLRAAAFAAAAEQAKYNLGHVYRTINVPTLPLLFLLPDNQARFRFKVAGTEVTSGGNVAVVNYEERDRPTMIRTPGGRSIVSRGTIWIDPSNGQVRRTELVTTEPRGLKSVISVRYDFDKRLDLLVPTTMRESYVTAEEDITAVATYSNFRRFETEARIVR